MTRMDNRIEVLENTITQIQPLGTFVIKLKGHMEHLNARLGIELGKMNEKLEVSLPLGKKELSEGLEALRKMFKKMAPQSSVVTRKGSRMKSTGPIEEDIISEAVLPERVVAPTVEGNYRKLELPLFNGVDPDSLIFRAERYFSMSKLIDAERAVAIGICMEGSALSWFLWKDGRQPICSWIELKQWLLERFWDTQYRTLHQ